MINFFYKIYGKIQGWVIKLVLAYNDAMSKNFQRQNCNYCGKRHLFDVPVGVPIEQIVFICKDCEKKRPNWIEELNGSAEDVIIPSGMIPEPITEEERTECFKQFEEEGIDGVLKEEGCGLHLTDETGKCIKCGKKIIEK